MSSQEKQALRRRYRNLRDSISSGEVRLFTERITRRLVEWPLFQQARTVMAYIAFGKEIDLRPILETVPKRWIIPRTLRNPEPQMILHPFDPARLIKHPYGMLEPDSTLPEVDPSEIDMVLAPGIVFDRRGYRLGYGAGFYDRFLPRTSALRVGLVYEDLLLEHLPTDEHDQAVDYIVCEYGILAAKDKRENKT